VTALAIIACGDKEVTQDGYKDTYGEDWPLTISKVTLHCLGDGQTNVVWVESDDVMYPLTGFSMTYLRARTEYQTIVDINSIRRPETSGVGLMSIDTLRKKAREKC
jgi:hypothetical protein